MPLKLPPLLNYPFHRIRRPLRLQKRRAMTVAASFRFDGGILLCADTKISTYIKTNESKIFASEYSEGAFYSAICVACNNFDLAKGAVRECEEALANVDIGIAAIASVRDQIQDVLTKFYHLHVLPRPADESDFELLIGILLNQRPQLYYSSRTEVLNEVSSYRCIGSGAYLANYLIGRCGPYDSLSRDEIGLMASYVLERVKDHDEAVGGEIEFFIIQPHEIGPYVPPPYPSDSFPENIEGLSWDMLRKLCRVENRELTEWDAIIEDYCDEVRRLARSDRHWFDQIKKLKSTESNL